MLMSAALQVPAGSATRQGCLTTPGIHRLPKIQGILPSGKAGDEVVCIGGLSSLLDLLPAGARPTEADVEADGGGKQNRLLADQPHLGAQPGEGYPPDVCPIQQHLKHWLGA